MLKVNRNSGSVLRVVPLRLTHFSPKTTTAVVIVVLQTKNLAQKIKIQLKCKFCL